jgi:hypothetical protein
MATSEGDSLQGDESESLFFHAHSQRPPVVLESALCTDAIFLSPGLDFRVACVSAFSMCMRCFVSC